MTCFHTSKVWKPLPSEDELQKLPHSIFSFKSVWSEAKSVHREGQTNLQHHLRPLLTAQNLRLVHRIKQLWDCQLKLFLIIMQSKVLLALKTMPCCSAYQLIFVNTHSRYNKLGEPQKKKKTLCIPKIIYTLIFYFHDTAPISFQISSICTLQLNCLSKHKKKPKKKKYLLSTLYLLANWG